MNPCRGPLRRLKASSEHVAAFKALAHRGRLETYFFVVRAGREVAVGEIQEALGVPGPTLSHHLAALVRAGLLTTRREERFVRVSVRNETATALVRLLSACC